jgi:mono/diheme cytochrome c family protein
VGGGNGFGWAGVLGFFLILAGGAAPVLAEGDIATGKAIFFRNCAVCHGTDGEGNGPSSHGMSPPPPNFTDPGFWEGKTDSFLIHVIVNGLGQMPSWSETLSPRNIEDVLSYIKTFRK